MEFRVLKYFLEVAREENITAAAKILHISQPTLSKQLMELEDKLGKKLFIRGKRKITLTEDGILLQKRASEIIELVEKTKSQLNNTNDVIFGDIYLGAAETYNMSSIANICVKLHEDYKNIHYHLFSGNSKDVLEKLDKGLLDFGILLEATDINKYNYIKLQKFDTWGLLMRKDNPLATKEYITSNDLLNIPLLCSRQAIENNELAGWLKIDTDKLDIVATYNLVYNATLFVKEGLGVAITLDKLVNVSNNSDLCFRPFMPSLTSNLVLVWKKHQVFSKPAQKFLEYINKKVK